MNVDRYGDTTSKQSLKDRARWAFPFNAFAVLVILVLAAVFDLNALSMVIGWLVGAIGSNLVLWYLDDMPRDERKVNEYKVYK